MEKSGVNVCYHTRVASLVSAEDRVAGVHIAKEMRVMERPSDHVPVIAEIRL